MGLDAACSEMTVSSPELSAENVGCFGQWGWRMRVRCVAEAIMPSRLLGGVTSMTRTSSNGILLGVPLRANKRPVANIKQIRHFTYEVLLVLVDFSIGKRDLPQ